MFAGPVEGTELLVGHGRWGSPPTQMQAVLPECSERAASPPCAKARVDWCGGPRRSKTDKGASVASTHLPRADAAPHESVSDSLFCRGICSRPLSPPPAPRHPALACPPVESRNGPSTEYSVLVRKIPPSISPRAPSIHDGGRLSTDSLNNWDSGARYLPSYPHRQRPALTCPSPEAPASSPAHSAVYGAYL